MDTIVIPIFYVFISAILPFYVGKKRQIGFGWSWWFSITMSPILGLIVILLSKELSEGPPSKSKVKVLIGRILIIIAVLSVVMNFSNMVQNIYAIMSTVAYFSLGVYLIGLGKGKVYNKKYVNPSNNLEVNKLEFSSHKNMNFKNSSFIIRQKKINGKVRLYIYLVVSLLIGFFLGWYYKLPNEKLLEILLDNDSKWRKDLTLEFARKQEPFFSSEYFSFNWVAFILVTVACLLCLMSIDYFDLWPKAKEKVKSLMEK